MPAILRPLLAAISFLTRLPYDAGRIEPREIGRAVACFPLVGVLLGAGALGIVSFAGARLEPTLTAALVVGAWALLTGGLHLDGVADLFDALGGGRGERRRMLEIMRDPHVGAHGASALVLVLILKVLALGALLARAEAWAAFAAPVCARAAATVLIAAFAYARPQGLGRAFHEHTRALHVLIAQLFAAAALSWIGRAGLAPAAASFAVVGLLGFAMSRKLDGLTGDVYGAAIELSEVAYLLTAAWSASPPR